MALNRYVLTADVMVPAGTAATVTAGDPGSGGAAGFGGAPTTGGPTWATTYRRNTVIMLDPAGPLYSQIGGSNLRAFIDGTDTRGGAALSN